MANQVNGLLSPFLRKKRIDAVKIHINGMVLDYGCGVGKLSELIAEKNYIGIDIDLESLNIAKENYVGYKFFNNNEFDSIKKNLKFNTIVSMAVIEHVKDPVCFLNNLKESLDKEGKIVLTTPHPKADWIHDIGSKIGLFSSHANEEHEELIDKSKMTEIANNAGMKMIVYEKFLFGVNQLIVLVKI